LRLFQNFSFEETDFAYPATYENHSFAARRVEKQQEPVPKQPIMEPAQ
jgi:hypothetical protein